MNATRFEIAGISEELTILNVRLPRQGEEEKLASNISLVGPRFLVQLTDEEIENWKNGDSLPLVDCGIGDCVDVMYFIPIVEVEEELMVGSYYAIDNIPYYCFANNALVCVAGSYVYDYEEFDDFEEYEDFMQELLSISSLFNRPFIRALRWN